MNNSAESLNQRLGRLHQQVREYFPFVVRIAVALHDSETDQIKTFLCSPADTSPITDYRVALPSAGWLNAVRLSRRPRVIDEIEPSTFGGQQHSLRILAAGYKSSYTVPIFDHGFLGFIFFDADRSTAFTPRVTRQLDLFVRIVSLTIENALRSVDVLVGGLHLLGEISRFRDIESSSHLSRISYYAEAIARKIAPEIGRDEAWVEDVRLFAPLHDIGKIAIPDAILLKRSGLTDAETAIMQRHTTQGDRILTTLIRELSLDKMLNTDGLRPIARHHHERWDGKGYPDGLSGTDIAIEARIIRIADVFDALTSRRCYKSAWPLERARAHLQEGAGTSFDPRCVEIFLSQSDEIAGIMRRFTEESSEAT